MLHQLKRKSISNCFSNYNKILLRNPSLELTLKTLLPMKDPSKKKKIAIFWHWTRFEPKPNPNIRFVFVFATSLNQTPRCGFRFRPKTAKPELNRTTASLLTTPPTILQLCIHWHISLTLLAMSEILPSDLAISQLSSAHFIVCSNMPSQICPNSHLLPFSLTKCWKQ